MRFKGDSKTEINNNLLLFQEKPINVDRVSLCMHVFVTLTSECNLKCKYCYGKCAEDFGSDYGDFLIDYSIPDEMSYDITTLRNFSEQKPLESLVFYGGEPLLRIKKMQDVIDNVYSTKFILQTNGLLLDKLEPHYLNKLDTILVSIDGDEKLTDHYRGNGVYKKVLKNVSTLRNRGFEGELIARMTVGEETYIDESVMHLLFIKDRVFNSVHWQLDAQFWKNDFNPHKFANWTENQYRPRLMRLIDKWIEYIEQEKTVMKIYPFLAIVNTLLTRKKHRLRCGAGWAQYNIQTDGNIVPCPNLSGMKDYYLGNIASSQDEILKKNVNLGSPCVNCGLLWICGGRCLYANITKLWGESGFKLVCNTVHILIGGLQQKINKIQQMIKDKDILISDFKYTEFNSCEIIP